MASGRVPNTDMTLIFSIALLPLLLVPAVLAAVFLVVTMGGFFVLFFLFLIIAGDAQADEPAAKIARAKIMIFTSPLVASITAANPSTTDSMYKIATDCF